MPPADIFTAFLYSFGATAAGVPADVRIGEIEWETLEWTETLNRPLTFAGTTPYWRPRAADLDLPAARHVYVDVGGVLRAGGIIWATDLNAESDGLLRFQGEGFLSGGATGKKGARRTIRSRAGMTFATFPTGYPTEVFFSAVDEFRIVKDLLDHAANIAGAGNQFGFDAVNFYGPGGGGLSGQVRTRQYFSYDRKALYAIIEELSAQQPGFDFAESFAWDFATSPPTPRRYLNLYYPRRGVAASGVTLEHGINCTLQPRSTDGRAVANPLTVVGAGFGQSQLFSEAIDASYIYPAGVFPYLEGQVRYQDEATQANLDRLAAAGLSAGRQGPVVVTADMDPQADTKLGDVNVGDTCRTIGAFIGPLDQDSWLRVVQQRIVAQAATGLTSWQLVLATADATLGI